MSQNAYIKLVPASERQVVTIEEVKDMFDYYKSITAKTGEQLLWGYSEAAFPYTIEEKPEGKDKWIYLKGIDSSKNRYILIGVGFEHIEHKTDESEATENQQCYIQVSLTDISTHGDKGKANEFCKFLASKLKGELHLFNGRVMYYYPKK